MKGKAWRLTLTLTLTLFLIASTLGFQVTANGSNYYHTNGSRIEDVSGNTAKFNGVSWFGFETANFAPHGLWTRSMDSILDQIKGKGYNLLRIPYTNEMFQPGKLSNSIDYSINPDLQGLTPIQILDKLIEKVRAKGMKVLLDRHRPTSVEQSELWYTSTVSETTWVEDWKMLAQRYLGNDTVIGADLHNEPHGNACWGCGDLARDWRLAAERAGNAILSVNSNWLIIVEGVSSNVQGQTGNYWWGGNLKGVQNDPVRLDVANRVVYSPHDYGPGVASQPWFSDPTFPNNLPSIWDAYWGYIHKNNVAPILVGEFGGRNVDTTSSEGKWQNTLVDYIRANNMYWTYWCVNPNSGDTGGLLLDDWVTWNQPKQDMLNRLMEASPGPTVPRAPASVTATDGNTQASLSWTATNDATSYNVKRSTTSGGPYTTLAVGVTGTSYTDTGLTNGTTYYYVVSAVNSVGESPNSAQVGVTPQRAPSGNLTVQYRAADTNVNDNQIKPHLNIKNNGTNSVNLSDLKIRYYFTKDGSSTVNAWIDWAQVGGENIQHTFASTSGNSTDTYVELSFSSGAGSIPAGGQSGEVQLRMAKTDWSNFNEANDYSFDETKTSFVDWDKVTLFQNGTLVWGIQP
ncbi:cellulase family glycosylhydrolase [Paenibacillus guangzhouensis]|uniref:cellulase family glycosylhydrolase n=1 Tax=Paenibacillus guangzhouensis TaxID=1473112 RepID=UPI001266A02A|nr:cellulase family glycosylhydrolase [Paenibacillus guangzhouensis]